MQDKEIAVINLIRSVISDYKCEAPEDEGAVMDFAREHSLSYITAHALAKVTGKNNYLALSLAEAAKVQRQEAAQATFSDALEKAAIDHIALKGAVLRKLYPEPYMRSSCDIDILVREKDLERALEVILPLMPCETTDKRGHDIMLKYGGGLVLELHFSLAEDHDRTRSVLDTVWDNAVLCDGKNHTYEMTVEFFTFHLLSHAAHHFVSGGCGIRPFIDLYLTLLKLSPDMQKVFSLCRECGIETFSKNALHLMRVWFDGYEHTDTTLMMQNYLFPAGSFGNLYTKMAMYKSISGGKAKYVMRQIFPPVKDMTLPYPVLKKAPVLLPVMWIARLLRLLFSERTAKGIKKIRMMNKVTDKSSVAADKILDKLELR